MPPEPVRTIGAGIASARRARSLLRNHGGGHAPVSYLELFFDLVYVFAITQLSYFLHHHRNLIGFVEGIVLFLALWWVWMYTTWVINWADPDRLPVRIMLLVLMLLSLVMAVSLPHAFAEQAAIFAGSYVALQLGRTLCMVWFFSSESRSHARNMLRVATWFAVSAIFWAIGAWRGEDERLGWWMAALAIEYAGPFLFFRVPGLGRSSLADWDISGGHMAERCALFIIIALGEGIVVTGSAFAKLPMERGLAIAFAYAFLSSVLMWWLYFDLGAKRGTQLIESHANPGWVARNAYTYLHMPIVAGIVVSAVADALVLEHWREPASLQLILTLCGGALTYLVGLGLFKRSSSPNGNFPLSHIIGIILFVLLGIGCGLRMLGTLGLGGGGVVILAIVAWWEWFSLHGGWLERIEARGWRLGKAMRRYDLARRARRAARSSNP